jgi:hypothetical protein
MASKKKVLPAYPLILPFGVTEVINDLLNDGEIFADEFLGPDVISGVNELNVRTGVAGDDEEFAGWNYGFDGNGHFFVAAVQPGTCKGKKKTFIWDANKKKFI